MAAVAELVRARAEPAVGERRHGGERERGAQVAAHVLADGQLVDLVLGNPVHEAAGLFGALGGVLGQVAGDLAASVLVETANVELVAPVVAAAAELVRQRRRDRWSVSRIACSSSSLVNCRLGGRSSWAR